MYVTALEANIQSDHEEILRTALEQGAGQKFIRMSQRHAGGHWKKFVGKVDLFTRPLKGGVFLDFGCKFGHITPILANQGVSKIYSIDVDLEHVSDGAKFIGSRYNAEYMLSDNCYIDVPPNSVDFILVNEVISHINPAFMDIFYSEMARVLKPGGEIVISDGNNFSHLQTRLDLLEWYSLWETGKSKEFGDSNYNKYRRNAIAKDFPDLTPDTLDYLAANTSGLYGERLRSVVRRYLEKGVLTERPHRPSVFPTHPVYGVVMERGFFPAQVELALKTYGVDAVQLRGGRPIASEQDRGRTKNFTIRGIKLADDVELLKTSAALELERVRSPATSVAAVPVTDARDRESRLLGAAQFAVEVGHANASSSDGPEGVAAALVAQLISAAIDARDESRGRDAAALLRAAAALHPTNRRVERLITAATSTAVRAAKVAELGEDSHAAFEAWSEVLAVAPKHAVAIRRVLKLAKSLALASNDYGMQSYYYGRIVSLDPANAAFLNRYVRAMSKAGREIEAFDYLAANSTTEASLQALERVTALLNQKARAEFRKGNITESLQCLQRLKRAGLDDTPAALLRHRIAEKLARGLRGALAARSQSEAAHHAKLLAELDPKSPLSLQMLARFNLRYRSAEDSLPFFERLSELEPQNPRRWFELARARRLSSDLGAAKQAVSIARDLAPDNAQIDHLARLLAA